ncbi:MAG: HD domain-containing phosphohydrolase [Chloroflexota bacterium]
MPHPRQTSEHQIRLAALVAALSLATDLGMGQPMEQALRTCLLSINIGRELRLNDEQLSNVYYLALLRFVGCTSDAHEQAAQVGGDEIAHRAGLATVLMGEPSEFMGHMMRHFATGSRPLTRLRLFAGAMAGGTREPKRSIALHCEVAQVLAARMGLRAAVGQDVGHVFERWDGRGLPGELSGEAIPIAARVVAVTRDVDVFHGLGGWELVAQVLRRRRAKAYDPSVVDVVLDRGESWLAATRDESVWERVLDVEPEPCIRVAEAELGNVLRAFAEFADLKSPFTAGHSLGVARLAEGAARHAGLGESECVDLRRAALVRDLGRTGIPNGIWDRPGALSAIEWERVRLHPYLTERMLSHAETLQRLAPLAGSHHERLNGSGYYRQASGPSLPFPARLLAAADAYQAMTQERPHRPALAPDAAAQELNAETRSGCLDPGAVRAVRAAAGHPASQRATWPAGLTDREVEVLRLIAQGHSYRQVAKHLTITPQDGRAPHRAHLQQDRRLGARLCCPLRHGARSHPALITAILRNGVYPRCHAGVTNLC